MSSANSWMVWMFLAMSCSVAAAGETPLDEMLLRRGAARDLAGVESLRERAMTSPDHRYAYLLARYLADPDRFVDAFVREFPANASMTYVYALELAIGTDGAQLTPYFLYAFDQLGMLAIQGKVEAIGKLYEVMLHSDAVVSEAVCESIYQTIERHPASAVERLAALEVSRRRGIYDVCLSEVMPADAVEPIKQSIGKPEHSPHAEVVKEILAALEQDATGSSRGRLPEKGDPP